MVKICFEEFSKNCQLKELSKNYQRIVTEILKNYQKIVELSENFQGIIRTSKNCQRIIKDWSKDCLGIVNELYKNC